MTSEQTRRDVVELLACGRVQDAMDRVTEYFSTSKHPNHMRNQIKKLSRLGILCGSTFIVLDDELYIPGKEEE